MRNILVATDFSADAERALDWALELAKPIGAQIHVLHAYYIDIPVSVHGFLAFPDDAVSRARAGAQARLEGLAQRLAPITAIQTHLSVLDPVTAILELANSLPADLIVMGTRGLSGIKHVIFGSVAECTVRLSACPVLTVKAPRP
jgi:nucleotide-binding universal stress UspA family protein